MAGKITHVALEQYFDLTGRDLYTINCVLRSHPKIYRVKKGEGASDG
jgi:hypothetical protein